MIKTIPLPSQEYLLDCFEHIGLFLLWLERPIDHFMSYRSRQSFNARWAGTIAGCLDPKGYVKIGLDGQNYYAHRLIYKIHTGLEPSIIDHDNRIKYDNRFNNLKSGTQAENLQNQNTYKNNSTGYPGICRYGLIWRVQVSLKRKRINLGRYNTLNEAIQAKKEWDEA